MSNQYKNDQKLKDMDKIRTILCELPKFCEDYFIGIRYSTTTKTQLAYAHDLKMFFYYIHGNLNSFKNKKVVTYSLEDLQKITALDIEQFLNYAGAYKQNGNIVSNSEVSIKRKLSAIRSLFSYYHKKRLIDNNPSLQVQIPKLRKKNIIRLDKDETNKLLNSVEQTNLISKRAITYNKNYSIRDYAIITLLLGTGIRVSELVGLNLNDVNFNDSSISIIRKGEKEDVVYFNAVTRDALIDYINIRKNITPFEGNEDALFLSSQRKRMQSRSIEYLVKKYAMNVTTKHITPHKLRSTFGTRLYEKTGDIYLVAETLGHEDVNTTKKYYAAISEERKKIAKDLTY